MDEREEDKSEESRKRHITYYKSLSKIIENIENEIQMEKETLVIKHLKDRIEAIDLDQKRIEKLFPGIKEEIEKS